MENPKYSKSIKREGRTLFIGHTTHEIEYTSSWEKVEGAKNVFCKTWEIKKNDMKFEMDTDADGADILIKAGGYTSIQFVNSAEVVVDAPEEGIAYCCVLDTDGQIYVNYFNTREDEPEQMTFSKGMIVCWIAQSDVKITEFENPNFNSDMFETIQDNDPRLKEGIEAEYLTIIKNLRKVVNSSIGTNNP